MGKWVALACLGAVICATSYAADETPLVQCAASNLTLLSQDPATGRVAEVESGSTIETLLPQHDRIATPISGLFVGISNYDFLKNPPVTPAHTVSALLMRALFTSADDRALYESMQDNVGSSSYDILIDLRVNPTESANSRQMTNAVTETLKHIPGFEPFEWSDVFDVPRGGWGLTGGRPKITKALLLETVKKHAESLQSKAANPQSAPRLAIVYIAAHGLISAEGDLYVLASDSQPANPATWMSAAELVRPFKGVPESTAVLIILDVCQKTSKVSVPKQPALAEELGARTALILSASPGEYSWHWPRVNKLVKTDLAQLPLGDDPRSVYQSMAAPPRIFDYSYESRMSVLPAVMSMEACAFERRTRHVAGSRASQLALGAFLDGARERGSKLINLLLKDTDKKQHIEMLGELGSGAEWPIFLESAIGGSDQ